MGSLRSLLLPTIVLGVAVVVDSLSLEPIVPPTITLGEPFTVTWHRNVQGPQPDPTDWFLYLGTPFFSDFLGQIVFDVPGSTAPDGTLTAVIPTTGIETGSMQIVAGERSLPNGKPWATPVPSIMVVQTGVALTSQQRDTNTPVSTGEASSSTSSSAASTLETDSSTSLSLSSNPQANTSPETASTRTSTSPSLPSNLQANTSSNVASDPTAGSQPIPSNSSNGKHGPRLDVILPLVLCGLFLIGSLAQI